MRQIFGLLGPRTSRRDEIFAAMAHASTPMLKPDQTHQQPEVAVGVIGPSTPTSFAASHLQVDPHTGIVGAYLGNAIPRETGIDDANPYWLPRAYAKHGTNLFHLLPDQFVVAIWDSRSHELLLARDRLGQLPLYYSYSGKQVSFASRLPTLLVDGQQDLEIDLHAVSHYLEYKYVPAPRSIYSGISKLAPAHYAVFSAQGVATKRYWTITYNPKTTMTIDQAGNHIRSHLLDQARKATSVATPVGAYLSGGLDSSAVVAALARTSSQPISTFAIGFESATHDELPHARVVAERYGTDHHELVVTPAALNELDLLVDLFGEPYADASALPSLFAARQAGSHAEVVFTGDGGDETLGGYTRYLMHPSRSNRFMWRGFSSLTKMLPPSGYQDKLVDLVASRFEQPSNRYARSLSVFRPERASRFLGPALRRCAEEHDVSDYITQLWGTSDAGVALDRMTFIDLNTYLPGDVLPKVEVTTAAENLTPYSPFLTASFVDWSATLSHGHKLHEGSLKHVLKVAMDPWLPSELIHRKKQGFGVPLHAWFQREWAPLLKDVTSQSYGVERGWWNKRELDRMVQEQIRGINHSARLYTIVMLELWVRHATRAIAKV